MSGCLSQKKKASKQNKTKQKNVLPHEQRDHYQHLNVYRSNFEKQIQEIQFAKLFFSKTNDKRKTASQYWSHQTSK